jgi:hypothetical protein
MKLYGLGSRGVAVYPPESDTDRPIPLFRSEAEVEAIIARKNERHGVGNLHVISFVVEEAS